MRASRSTSRQPLPRSCRERSAATPNSNAASCQTNGDAGERENERGMLSTSPLSSPQNNASDEGELQSRETGCAVELTIEFVEFAKGDFHDATELFEIVDVDDGVDVVEKRGVRIHRAQRRRQEHEEQPASLVGPQHVYFANDKRRALLRSIELRLEQHDVELLRAHRLDRLARLFSNKNLVIVVA